MIRLILLLILFFISLLAIFPAPTHHLWILAITVTEFPIIYIVLVAFILLSGLWAVSINIPANVIGALALILFLSPIVQAAFISNKVDSDLTKTFGKQQIKQAPFSLFKMVAGNDHDKIHPIRNDYQSASGTQLSLHFYAAQSDKFKPCVIVIHGGSWKSGDNEQIPELNSTLAYEGYHVAAITYRLAPEFNSPAPVEDVRSAIAYLKANAETLKIDTNQLVLLGRSAGAQIALIAAYTFKDKSIKGVIDFYGPADMVWGYHNPASPLVMNSCKVMEDYLGGTYNQIPQKYEDSSPVNFVGKEAVPTLMLHGENDVLVSYLHSTKLQQKLLENKVPHYLLSLPWATHGFDYSPNGSGGQLSSYAVVHFLRSVLH